MNRYQSGTKLGILGAVALAVGLLGAGVTACDLTQPSHFHDDSSGQNDSLPGQADLSPTLERLGSLAFLDASELD